MGLTLPARTARQPSGQKCTLLPCFCLSFPEFVGVQELLHKVSKVFPQRARFALGCVFAFLIMMLVSGQPELSVWRGLCNTRPDESGNHRLDSMSAPLRPVKSPGRANQGKVSAMIMPWGIFILLSHFGRCFTREESVHRHRHSAQENFCKTLNAVRFRIGRHWEHLLGG